MRPCREACSSGSIASVTAMTPKTLVSNTSPSSERSTRPTPCASGSPAMVERIRAYRAFGSGWTSRILQQCLAVMLTDPLCRRQVSAAAKIYQRRNHALLAALQRRGIDGVTSGDLQLWVAVANEQYAMVSLAAHGISAISGTRYCNRHSSNHVPIATGRLPESDVGIVADAIAAAAGRAARGW